MSMCAVWVGPCEDGKYYSETTRQVNSALEREEARHQKMMKLLGALKAKLVVGEALSSVSLHPGVYQSLDLDRDIAGLCPGQKIVRLW